MLVPDTSSMDKALEYAKAIIAAVVAGLGTLWTALADGEVIAQEWVSVAIVTLGALAGTYAVPNKNFVRRTDV